MHPDLATLDFAQIFDRLIIGPTQYPASVREAFVDELERLGVKDAAERVWSSNIPIRT